MNIFDSAQKNLDMDEYGKQSNLHPTKLQSIKLKNGIVQEEIKKMSLSTCDNFTCQY